jgi:hypothetical protein
MHSSSALRRLVAGTAVGLVGALGVSSDAAPPAPAYVAVSPGLEYARLEADGVISHVLRLDLQAEGLSVRSLKAKGKETVREMVARTLRTFEGLDLIQMERGRIIVLDADGLRQKTEEAE